MKIQTTRRVKQWILRLLNLAALITSIVVVGIVLYEFGFPLSEAMKNELHDIHKVLFSILWLVITVRLIFGGLLGRKSTKSSIRLVVYIIFTLVYIISLLLGYGLIHADAFVDIATSNLVVLLIITIVSVSEISAAVTHILSSHANPAAILAGSFALIIFIGSLLLLLPNCTTQGISYIDSLFVSTSAVCVTGLTPIDVSAALTISGQFVLMLLIQIGGLGIMTITSFFGLFFAGGNSLSNQIMVKELLSGESLNGLLRTLLKIIVVTLCVEAAGAVGIFFTVYETQGIENPLFFSIFHAVSAFCNAGFSTLSGNLYDPVTRNMGVIMWIISLLIIFGGIGFPIFSNLLTITWHKIQNFMRWIFGIRRVHRPRMLNLNSYIVLRTTGLILIISWTLFLALEWNASLADFDFWDKIAQGFLCAVTPRTAGFSGVSYAQMVPASIFITIILMWIGGAPQSTAGGVKVTTIYLAFKNIFKGSNDKGIEVHNRTIPNSSVRRAFTIIGISLTIICISVVMLSCFEPKTDLTKIVFEVFSAIGTVGLSLDLTPILKPESKMLVIVLMFVGRVGGITILSLFLRRKSAQKPFTYPEEDILIN